MQVIATFAKNTPAYADIQVEVPDNASDEEICNICVAAADQVGDHVFKPSYDWNNDLRITSITKPDGSCVANDIGIDAQAENFGETALKFLQGKIDPSELVTEARRQGFVVDLDVEKMLESMGKLLAHFRGGSKNAWVIYHDKQPSGKRFWSDEYGWTGEDKATRYAKMPHAPYPLCAHDHTQAAALRLGTMKEFTVILCDLKGNGDRLVRFDCFAENKEHAIEQAASVHPSRLAIESVMLTAALDN